MCLVLNQYQKKLMIYRILFISININVYTYMIQISSSHLSFCVKSWPCTMDKSKETYPSSQSGFIELTHSDPIETRWAVRISWSSGITISTTYIIGQVASQLWDMNFKLKRKSFSNLETRMNRNQVHDNHDDLLHNHGFLIED